MIILNFVGLRVFIRTHKTQAIDVGSCRIEAVVVIAPLGPLSRQENVSLAFAGKMDKFPSNSRVLGKITKCTKNSHSDLSVSSCFVDSL